MPPSQRKEVALRAIIPALGFLCFVLVRLWLYKTVDEQDAGRTWPWVDEPARPSRHDKAGGGFVAMQLAYAFALLPAMWILHKLYRTLTLTKNPHLC